MGKIDLPPSANAHPRAFGRNSHRTGPPTAATHRLGPSPAAAHRLRRFIQLNRPSTRTPTVDALVTSMHIPSGGLEAAHLAETIAAVALNAGFGAISTIHVLFEAAHYNKGCALVRSVERLAHLLAGRELRCIDVARQPTYYQLLEYCSRVLAGRVVLLANPDIVFDPADLRAPQRGHSAATRSSRYRHPPLQKPLGRPRLNPLGPRCMAAEERLQWRSGACPKPPTGMFRSPRS